MDDAKAGMTGGEEGRVCDVERGCGVECVGQRLRLGSGFRAVLEAIVNPYPRFTVREIERASERERGRETVYARERKRERERAWVCEGEGAGGLTLGLSR